MIPSVRDLFTHVGDKLIEDSVDVGVTVTQLKSKSKSSQSDVDNLLNRLRDTYSFDILRDVRRMACLISLSTSSSQEAKSPHDTDIGLPQTQTQTHSCSYGVTGNSFRSFLLGASSCCTAMECVLERSSTASATTNAATSSTPSIITTSNTTSSSSSSINKPATGEQQLPKSVSDMSTTIRAACCNDSKALETIQKILENKFQFSANGRDALCFAVIEQSTKNLLLGRWDREGSTIVALPIAEELLTLMEEWVQCMSSSKALLHRTSDTIQVAKWTDTDKRSWWAERMASDVLIETLLTRLNDLLGPWTSILSKQTDTQESGGDIKTSSRTDSTIFKHQEESKDSSKNVIVKADDLIDMWGDVDTLQTEKPGNNLKHSVINKTTRRQITTSKSAVKTVVVAETIDSSSNGTVPGTQIVDSDEEKFLAALNDLKVTDLREQLREQKLSGVGIKKDLVTRLFEQHKMASSKSSNTSKSKSDNVPSHRAFPVINIPPDIRTYEDPAYIMVRSVDQVPKMKESEGNGVRVRMGLELDIHGDRDNVDDKMVDVNVDKFSKGKIRDCTTGLLCSDERTSPSSSTAGTVHSSVSVSAACHTVLILDEQLQQIPWEALPCLRSKQCSRVPSFALLLSMLTRDGIEKNSGRDRGIDNTPAATEVSTNNVTLSQKTENHKCNKLKHTWYAIDPEGNLPTTRDTMSAFLQPYIDTHSWPGYIGEIPSEEAAKYV